MTPQQKLLNKLDKLKELGELQQEASLEQVREMISLTSQSFTMHLEQNGFDKRQIVRLTTKLRDAGRRSPPWKAFSSRVPGRPQDGKDGNRTSRWILPVDHKFYATEMEATLVEIKYYLQCLSFLNAPPLPDNSIQDTFVWLTGHRIEPEVYLDPIQRIQIDLIEVIADAAAIQSGHLVPLDRNGKHDVPNTFLMLKRSNSLQGNLTVEELLRLMEMILRNHNKI